MSLGMSLSPTGLDLIKSFEGCRLTAYWDSTGQVWTIGYGHTGGVTDGEIITQAQADSFLMNDTSNAQSSVNNNVTVTLNQNQFDALVSFVFNIGSGGFFSSTLLSKLNSGEYTDAASQFDLWIHSGGVVLQGLVTRRAKEKALFLSAVGSTPVTSTSQRMDIRALQKFLNSIGATDNNGNKLIVDGITGTCTNESIARAKYMIQNILS